MDPTCSTGVPEECQYCVSLGTECSKCRKTKKDNDYNNDRNARTREWKAFLNLLPSLLTSLEHQAITRQSERVEALMEIARRLYDENQNLQFSNEALRSELHKTTEENEAFRRQLGHRQREPAPLLDDASVAEEGALVAVNAPGNSPAVPFRGSCVPTAISHGGTFANLISSRRNRALTPSISGTQTDAFLLSAGRRQRVRGVANAVTDFPVKKIARKDESPGLAAALERDDFFPIKDYEKLLIRLMELMCACAHAVDIIVKSGFPLSHVEASSLVFCLTEWTKAGRYTGFSIRMKVSVPAYGQPPAGVTAASSLADVFYHLLRSTTKHFVFSNGEEHFVEYGWMQKKKKEYGCRHLNPHLRGALLELRRGIATLDGLFNLFSRSSEGLYNDGVLCLWTFEPTLLPPKQRATLYT